MEKRFKFFKWATILLIVCNIGLMAMIFFGPPPPPFPPHGPHGGRPDEFLINELELTKEQQEKFKKLKREHRKAIHAFMEKGRSLRETYFSQLKQGNGNDSIIKQTAKAIGENQVAIEEATFAHFKTLRELLTETQKQVFDDIILEVLHRMAPPPPPPGPPPPPPPPPPAPNE